MLRSLAVVSIVVGWGIPVMGAPDDLRPGVLNPSATCGECHEKIYSMWQRSMHSLAYKDPIFQTSYMQAYLETAGEARSVCIKCHAPAALIAGDREAQQPVSQEGVTCDFCHSIVSVDLKKRNGRFQVSLDGAKRGPLADAESPVHGVVKSQLHESSELCAGCHEYSTPEGLAVMSTYSEWRSSPQAAEGKTCQSCHMPVTAGNTVRSEFGIERDSINLHNISGAHSSEQVRKAATAKIMRVEREAPTRAIIDVEVANVGSGHFIPTGMPTRKLVLEVTVSAGGREIRRFEREYQKKLMDANGQVIDVDHRAILDARKLLEDTRLRPGERRLERFATEVPATGALSVEMQLRYAYQPELVSRSDISIQIATDRSP
jgi:hypothetical protein